MHKRYLTVIKNNAGARDYDLGVEDSDNLKVYELPEDEFEALCNTDVFKKINNECNLMIDDFESEILNADNLNKCEKYMTDDVAKASKIFNTAVLVARETGIALGIDF